MTPQRPNPQPAEAERAERILTAARELLLAWGYKRVTVDEIARRARVGKGTVYLHWKTKEILFGELLREEFADVLTHVAEQVQQNPDLARPSTLVRATFLQQTQRPLARAIHTSDDDILGGLATTFDGHPIAQELGHHALLSGLTAVWRRHGLLTPGFTDAEVIYLIDAVLSGFLGGGAAVPPGDAPAPDQCANLLRLTIQGAVEATPPPAEPAVRAAAQDIVDLLFRTREASAPASVD
ncbi:TetR/AcrR family transcriptional regulator [Streptomyces albidoflavus]